MYIRVSEFEVGVNDGKFSGNEQQKMWCYISFSSLLNAFLRERILINFIFIFAVCQMSCT